MKEKPVCRGKNIINILLVICIFLLGAAFAYINLVQYKSGLNADVAAEGLVARVMWESKEWLPKEWYWGNELRIISTPNIAALFYGMTKSMCLSMGISCVIAGIFVVGSAYYLCRVLDFSVTQKLLLLFLIMMLPNSKVQIELMYIYAGYYAFHVGTYFLTLAIYLRLLKKKTVSKAVIAVVSLLHFLIGMQGVRGLLMITGPLMAVEVVRRIYIWWCTKEWKGRENLITGFVLVLNVLEYLGGKFPKSVGYPLSRNIRKAPQKLFGVVLPDFFKTLDWGNISTKEKIVFAVCLSLIVCLAIYIVVKGIRKKGISQEEWIFMNFFVSLFLTTAALTFTTVESSSRYFLVVYFAMAMGLSMLIGQEKRILNIGVCLAIAVLFMGNYNRVYYPMLTDKSYEEEGWGQIGEYLIQEGYECAYADFERANTITVYMDGEIQVSAVNSFSEMDVCKCLSSRKWYVPNVPKESKTAYIVSNYKMPEMEEFLKKHPEDVEFKTKIGIYSIYGSDYNYSVLTD